MLIIALVLALIGLVALVFAVIASNQLVAWVCIGASVIGVVLLIIDALRERRQREPGGEEEDEDKAEVDEEDYVDYPEEAPDQGDQTADSMLAEPPAQAAADAGEESPVSAEHRGDERPA